VKGYSRQDQDVRERLGGGSLLRPESGRGKKDVKEMRRTRTTERDYREGSTTPFEVGEPKISLLKKGKTGEKRRGRKENTRCRT